MINVRLQIGDGPIQDSYESFGFIYKSSDNRFAAPTKGFAKSSYAEQSGENIDPRTVDDAFDYKVKFVINCPNRNKQNANTKIKLFNDAICDKTGDIRTYKQLTLYNDYKRVIITGIPQPIAEVDDDDFFRDKYGNVYDIAVIELTIRVTDPNKCQWDMNKELIQSI